MHHHKSPADHVRELFKRSKDAASLLVWKIENIGKFWILFLLWVTS